MIANIIKTLEEISFMIPFIFHINMRARKLLSEISLNPTNQRLMLIDPLGYIVFLSLKKDAAFDITDSGGIQEENTYLGISCITARGNTARLVTFEKGTNFLLGLDMTLLEKSNSGRFLRVTQKNRQSPICGTVRQVIVLLMLLSFGLKSIYETY